MGARVALLTVLLATVAGLTAGRVTRAVEPLDNQAIIDLLRDSQATHRAAFRQGHTKVEVLVTRTGKNRPALIEGDVTWADGDFLLKYRVSDPEAAHFRAAADEFGDDWSFLLSNRDGVRIYNGKNGVLFSRTVSPASFDPIFNLDPWLLLFTCCPPTVDPRTGGRPWVEMIGLHPAMKRVVEHSVFSYEKSPDGSIKQTRRDPDGWVNEMVFSADFDLLLSSMTQRDPEGKIRQEARFQYRRAGKDIIPVECEFYAVPDDRAPVVKDRYRYSGWDVRKPVERSSLRIESFMRMARELKRQKDAALSQGRRGISEEKLRQLADQLRNGGFASP